MHKVLEINQVKTIISKHLNKKIIDNLLKINLGHKFYYNNIRLCAKLNCHKFYYRNDNILYAKTNTRYIYFCNFLNDKDIDVHHYLYEYRPNEYFIINIYSIYNYFTISINGKELYINEFESFFNDLDSNTKNYINSIKLLYKL